MKKKITIIICAVIIFTTIALVILLAFPGILIKKSNESGAIEGNKDNKGKNILEKTVYDERTGKSFNLVDGKVEVYLPTRVALKSTKLNYIITAEYDEKYRICEYNGCDNLYTESGDVRNPEDFNKKYIYNLNGQLDRIYYSGGGNDKDDFSFTYAGNNIIDIKNNNDCGIVDADKLNVHTSYDLHGFITEVKINPFSEIETFDITYSNDGLISSISEDGDNQMDYEYAYDENGRFTEMSASGEEGGYYAHYHNMVDREENHVVRFGKEFNYKYDEMTSYKQIYNFTYDEDNLTKLSVEDDDNYNNDISFECDKDGTISSITRTNIETKKKEQFFFSYENGQIKEIKTDDDSFDLTIDYMVGYIDMDQWEEYYKNYYYSSRYEVLKNPIDKNINAHHNAAPYIFEYTEGYWEQTIDYESFYYGYGFLYNWAVLPHVIEGDFYKNN